MQNIVTIGADVEVFVADLEGSICSSIGIVPGDKENPFATRHGFVHKDNVLAEFNIKPATRSATFIFNIQSVLADLQQILKKSKHTFAVLSSHMMEASHLAHPAAINFGCNPDYIVWDLSHEHIINSGMAGNLRTAGGHIHIGFSKEVTIHDQIQTAKACDLYLGLPSILADNDIQRRRLYGQAGAFRPKPYGIEYRVLSNFWIKDDHYMEWAFINATKAYKYRDVINGMGDKEIARIINTINTGDKVTAKSMCDHYGVEYP